MRWFKSSFWVILSVSVILIIKYLQMNCTYMSLPFVMFMRCVITIQRPQGIIL